MVRKKSSQRQVDLNILQRHRLRKSSKNPQPPKDQRLDPPVNLFFAGFFLSSKWRQAFEGEIGYLGQTGKISSQKSSNGPNWNPEKIRWNPLVVFVSSETATARLDVQHHALRQLNNKKRSWRILEESKFFGRKFEGPNDSKWPFWDGEVTF